MAELQAITGLAAVAAGYDAIFCDVWGVVHDGEKKSPGAEAALLAARRSGRKVILLTNSPRPNDGVAAQLDRLKVSRDAYDRIVTSGDVTRVLVSAAGRKLFHLGPARDRDLFAGLDIELVSQDEAEAVIATGLFDDEKETPDDYVELLARLHQRKLPMICANPDVVVHRGERLIWCAGALARDYAALGAEVRMAGKPYAAIYAVAADVAGVTDPRRVLCIGDGLNTDIRGANDYGADALLVVGGIHGDELGGAEVAVEALAVSLAEQDLHARYFLYALA